MKKFSNINESNVPRKTNEDIIKDGIDKIINSKLSISVDGELDNIISKNIMIDGIEDLKESIFDFLVDYNIKQSLFLMEKIKYQGYSNVESELSIFENQSPSDLKKHKDRVLSLLKKKDITKSAEQQANSIKDSEKAFYRAIAAKQLIANKKGNKKELNKIHDVFLFRAKALGYRL